MIPWILALLLLAAPRLVRIASVVIDGRAQDVWICAQVDYGHWTVPERGPVGNPAVFTVHWLVEGKKSLLGEVEGIYTGKWSGADDPQVLVDAAMNSPPSNARTAVRVPEF